MTHKRALAILGGMGPEASAYMYNRLIQLASEEFGAKNNNDFPEIILHSVPVPDFISTTKDKDEASAMLQYRVIQLNKLDISCISIACNTAHLLLPELQEVSKIPFVSMINAVVENVLKEKKKKIGLIATPITTKTKLYQKALEANRIETIIPTQEQIDIQATVIRNVIAGRLLKSDSLKLRGIADSLKRRGAEGIILGCTEMPLVFPQTYTVPVYNSVNILSRALLQIYYK
jgi:aspartate racemase